MTFDQLYDKIKKQKPLFAKEEVTFTQENLRKMAEFFYIEGYCSYNEEGTGGSHDSSADANFGFADLLNQFSKKR